MRKLLVNTTVLKPLHEHILNQGILVVDDSELQRSVAVEVLRSLGVDIIYEAAHGIDALSLLQRLRIPPAVVIVDLHMPTMDGIELIQQLSYIYPDISVVIVSGADAKLLDTLGSLVDACNMTMLGALAKPLNGDQLLRSLERYDSAAKRLSIPTFVEDLAVSDLKRAIRLGHIIPYYQPKISLKTGSVVGYEALARWRDPQKGIIAPAKFIDLAAEYGLLKELTLGMLETVLADMVAWNHLQLQPMVSLNIAVTLLEDRNFANQVIRSVKSTAILPSQIILEITESALMKDQAAALATIGRLKLKGFSFSIDDYGTGFSSMQQLSRIAFNELKIDRTFISGADENEHMRNILQSAVEMGHRLGLTTVAEGVERIEELRLLQKIGCDEIQGYLFACPMPVGDVLPWLNENKLHIQRLCQST